jgi:hypothetical protein
MAGFGMARRGAVRPGTVRPGAVRQARRWRGLGLTRLGWAVRSKAGLGKRGRRGLTGLGMARRSEASHGAAWPPKIMGSALRCGACGQNELKGRNVMVLADSRLNQRIAHLELPERMRGLKVNDQGFVVPWFVPYVDGKPDFRCMSGERMAIAVRLKRCWMCGQPLGKFMTFAIGSMCIVNRNIAEPPSHLACVEYAVRACPFLSQPRMRRNEKDLPEDGHVAGIGLKRNPGVTALWTTLSYRVYRAPNGGALFSLGDPEHIEFYAEGRRATREEILASMESGLPLLMEPAEAEGPEAVAELTAMYAKAMELVPA